MTGPARPALPAGPPCPRPRPAAARLPGAPRPDAGGGRPRPRREPLGGGATGARRHHPREAAARTLGRSPRRAALRGHYGERDSDWARGVVARDGLRDVPGAGLRRAEDAAYGLRWLELADGLTLALERSPRSS